MGDWSAGLISSEATRGLSGGAAPSVALDADNPAYNYRLRTHEAGGDLVADPRRLWEPSPDSGLAGHAATEAIGDELPFTDVLVVLSADDHAAASAAEGWFTRARDVLARQLAGWCAREGLKRRSMRRPLGVRFVRDGSPETGGTSLGLVRGAFVTSLVPNLYAGPVEGSRERFVLHMSLPGVWDGWREIGRLYDDQALFTLGNHWLDNFSHPALREHALYRLVPGTRPLHRLNPDLQDRFHLMSTTVEGTPIVTIATKEGRAVANLVIVASDTPPPVSEKPGKKGVPSIAPPMVSDGPEPSRAVVPEAPATRVLALQERGALLQKVHFGAFMLGYDVYVDRHGELATVPDAPVLTWAIRRKSLAVVAHIEGCSLDHEPLDVGKETEIEGDAIVVAGGNEFHFRDLRDVGVDGWPYVGEIRRPVSATYVPWSDVYAIGRSRECRVLLPDEPRNDNIHWKPGVADGATIRARTGDIPKSQFYTDSIMVATTHASVDLSLPSAQLVCSARQCYLYIRRGEDVLPLYPTASGLEPVRRELRSGDEVLVGNSVFQVRYPPIDTMVKAAPPPRFPSPTVPPSQEEPASRPSLRLVTPEDSPSVGSGEPLTPLPRLSPAGPDSIFDMPIPEPEPLVVLADEAVDDDVSAGPVAAADTGSWEIDEWAAAAPEDSVAEEMTAAEPIPEVVAVVSQPQIPEPPEPVVVAVQVVEAPVVVATPPTQAPHPPPVVVSVDEASARFELARPLHLVASGWMMAGRFVLGNHTGADGVLPENRHTRDQTFAHKDYLAITVKGKKVHADVLAQDEVLVDEKATTGPVEDVSNQTFDVIRRDEDGQEDFSVRLTVETDKALPDPRARLLRVDVQDALAAALLTTGFPKGISRRVHLGGIGFEGRWDGAKLTVSNYIDSYRRGDTFHPFFVANGGSRFRTAPEDGEAFTLAAGDRLVIGTTVIDVRTE